MTSVYLVNAYNSYYPDPDNTIAVFTTEEEAEKFVLNYVATEKYKPDYVKIFEKVIGVQYEP